MHITYTYMHTYIYTGPDFSLLDLRTYTHTYIHTYTYIHTHNMSDYVTYTYTGPGLDCDSPTKSVPEW
jgi:hypothetical protein